MITASEHPRPNLKYDSRMGTKTLLDALSVSVAQLPVPFTPLRAHSLSLVPATGTPPKRIPTGILSNSRNKQRASGFELLDQTNTGSGMGSGSL
jgi:hypothetical protein